MGLYKAIDPEDTILWIRRILYDLKINVIEQHFRKEGLYYSCRIKIDNNDIRNLDVGTNGKGMNSMYSLASAYGELMERIQNKMLLLATKYASPDFCYNNNSLSKCFVGRGLSHRFFPDEILKDLSYQDFLKDLKCFCPNSFSSEKIEFTKLNEGVLKMYYLDFYNVMNKQVESLPYLLIRYAASSTGLCAGNTPSEAILQGLNEIFERYVLQQIYVKRITPPDIPLSFFEGTDVLHRLNRLQKETGWTFQIKDCSLGVDFPVIGLLIIDRKTNKYMFKLGADLDPEIALQRCFTESFQGTNLNSKYLKSILLDDDWNAIEEHNKNVINGTGRYPKEIFSKKSSWQFKGFEIKKMNSHTEGLLSVVSWLNKKGYKLYVRDNSFLGFPAYHLFIPGLSDINSDLYDIISEIESNNDNFYSIKSEYRIHSLSLIEIEKIIEKYKYDSVNYISLFPYNDSVYNKFNRLLLLALLSYKIGKDIDAYNYMKLFLIQKENEGIRQSTYYYCVRDFYYAKSLNLDEQDILSMLSPIYTENLVEEVMSDLDDRNNVLDNLPLPNCFNCNSCKINKDCRFRIILDIEKVLQKKQNENIRSQKEVMKVFETQ